LKRKELALVSLFASTWIPVRIEIDKKYDSRVAIPSTCIYEVAREENSRVNAALFPDSYRKSGLVRNSTHAFKEGIF
jgi:hypothetical protein